MNDKVHLLLIDDEKNYLLVLETLLTEAGYAVTALNDPETALAFLEESEVDIVITDMKMPRISGREVLERVKKNWPHIPVLIMTAFGSIESAVEAMRYGAFNYITKPFSNDELLLSIQNAAELARAHRQYQLLRESLEERYGKHQIIGRSRAIRDMLALVDRAGPSRATVLITGESGTGKELVARAIALSQYIPFDAKSRKFRTAYPDCFRPVHLSALPQTMLESELFGHRKGAYTGALADRIGYLEACDPSDAVLLDEIGEINAEVQVKLLRVLQTRRFQRLGDNAEREFAGKIIAATNRDLAGACREGVFRHDLYYRLCSDVIRTVPLRDLTGGEPGELEKFVDITAARLLGEEEAKRFVPEAMEWIVRNLGSAYPWPGNVRELEQCVRNLVIRGCYTPGDAQQSGGTELENALGRCGLTAEELMRLYVKVAVRRSGSRLKAAGQLGLDRRTVARYLAGETPRS